MRWMRRNDSIGATPLPKKKIFILLCIFISESLAINMLFPFVPFMIRDFKIADNEKQVGYYVGLLASSFNLAQFFSGYWIGWASDRIGRRPVLLSGLCFNIIFMTLFGLSKTLWWALLFRSMNGLVNGNNGVAKTYLREITDSSNQSRAFAYTGTTWGFGSIVGPIIGGYLSRPTETLPFLFEGSVLFSKYPYLLPCLICSLINACGLIVGFFFLEESLPSKRYKNFEEVEMEDPTLEIEAFDAEEEELAEEKLLDNQEEVEICKDNSPMLEVEIQEEKEIKKESRFLFIQILKQKRAVLAITTSSLLALQVIILQEVFPLWSSYSIEDNGLGFSTNDIGTSQMVMGITLLLWVTFVYPRIDRKFGSVAIFKWAVLAFVPICFSIPFLHHLARNRTVLWLCLLTLFAARSCSGTSAFTSQAILVNNCANQNIGAVNGLAASCVSLNRSLGPFVGGSLFAWSQTNGLSFPFDYHFVFFLSGLISLSIFVLAWFFPVDMNKRVEDR